ncbi:cation:proton antiporter [Flindersiella endophytica]
MVQLLLSLAFVGVGLLIGKLLGLSGLESSQLYFYAISALLAVGLFASTYAIDRRAAKQNLRIILLAITVGVVLKAVLIGGSLALLLGTPLFLVLGVAVAQIDPLSVAQVMRHPRLSERAKAILGSWSSFDDPLTVVLALYASVLAASMMHRPGGQPMLHGTDLTGYLLDLGLNAGLVLAAYAVWRLVRRHQAWAWVVLIVLIAVAVGFFLLPGLAVAGLFFRPDLDRIAQLAVPAAFLISLVMLGILLVPGVNLVDGLLLGGAAFLAQICVGLLLTLGLDGRDRVHLAFAQQNGITAIILALLLEAEFPGTVAIVAPAILTINLLHYLFNRVVDRWLDGSAQVIRQSPE